MSNGHGLCVIQRIAREVVSTVAEYGEAQRMLIRLQLAPDHYVFRPGGAPGDYAEFMMRTSGVLIHEPSARARAAGAYPTR